MNREEIINRVKEIILKKLKVDAIILFGSYARKEERQDSDIDVAIKPIEKIDKETLIDLQTILEEQTNLDVHLINLYRIEEDFRYDILITGETLYVKNEENFWEYKFKAYNDYLELNEDRKIIIDKLKRTLYGKRIGDTK